MVLLSEIWIKVTISLDYIEVAMLSACYYILRSVQGSRSPQSFRNNFAQHWRETFYFLRFVDASEAFVVKKFVTPSGKN